MPDNILWHILALLLTVTVIIIFPIVNTFEKQDRIVSVKVLNDTDLFLDKIKTKGFIDKYDFNEFKSKLSMSGYLFDIKFKHNKRIYVPVYKNINGKKTFTGKIKVMNEIFTDSEIKKSLFNDSKDFNGIYYMKRGDEFTVIVSSKVKSKVVKLKEMLFGINMNDSFYVKLNAVVQNEAY